MKSAQIRSFLWSVKSSVFGPYSRSVVYQNNLSFSEFLHLDNFAKVCHKKLQVLVTEVYKVKNGIATEIMENSFELQNTLYNLRSSSNQFRREDI